MSGTSAGYELLETTGKSKACSTQQVQGSEGHLEGGCPCFFSSSTIPCLHFPVPFTGHSASETCDGKVSAPQKRNIFLCSLFLSRFPQPCPFLTPAAGRFALHLPASMPLSHLSLRLRLGERIWVTGEGEATSVLTLCPARVGEELLCQPWPL